MDCPGSDAVGSKEFLDELRRKAVQDHVPLVGSIELTRRCNLHCVHCYLGSQHEQARLRQQEMSTDEIKRIIDQIAAAGCLNFLITGGDPLLRPDFPAIYQHAKLAGLLVAVFTNGTLVTDDVVRLFSALPPQSVEITLYGASDATYERITGVPGSYQRCLDGIQRLLDGGVRVVLKTVLMTHNRHELAAIEKMAHDYGVRFRFDAAISARLDGSDAPLALRVSPQEAVGAEFSAVERVRRYRQFHDHFGQPAPSDKIYQCGAGVTGFHVDPFGMLQPCMMVGSLSYDLRAGCFDEGWERMRAISDRRAAPGNRCTSCELRSVCGYCPGFLALENGSEDVSSPYLCALGSLRIRAIAAQSS